MPRLNAAQLSALEDQNLPASAVMEALGGRPHRGKAVVCCPAHNDRAPSLSIRELDDGRALLHCFAGCAYPEILAAVQKIVSEPEARRSYLAAREPANAGRFVESDERYEYSNGIYKAVGSIVDRETGEAIVPRTKRWMRDGRFWPGLMAPEWFVPAGVVPAKARALWLVSSESDAVALANAGTAALSVPDGDCGEIPAAAWPPTTPVFAVGDNDLSGEAWAERVVAALGTGRVRVPQPYKDAREAIEAGEDPACWAERATEAAPVAWADLSWLMADELPAPPTPEVLRRADGADLLYRGKVNGLFGDPEAGKSWVALAACAEELSRGGTAWYIDADHNGQIEIGLRLAALGVRRDVLADSARFRYSEPDGREELLALAGMAADLEPGVAVLDSLGELLPMMGAKTNDNDEVGTALRQAVMPWAAAGWCVVTIDHVTKNVETRNNYAIGAQSKKRALNGAYLQVVRCGPAPAPGAVGRARLKIAKDRPGGLRAKCAGDQAGVFVLDSTAPGRTLWRIETTKSEEELADAKGAETIGKVADFLAREGGHVSKRRVRTGVKGCRSPDKDDALEALVEEGYAELVTGKGYRLLKPHPDALTSHVAKWKTAVR